MIASHKVRTNVDLLPVKLTGCRRLGSKSSGTCSKEVPLDLEVSRTKNMLTHLLRFQLNLVCFEASLRPGQRVDAAVEAD